MIIEIGGKRYEVLQEVADLLLWVSIERDELKDLLDKREIIEQAIDAIEEDR